VLPLPPLPVGAPENDAAMLLARSLARSRSVRLAAFELRSALGAAVAAEMALVDAASAAMPGPAGMQTSTHIFGAET
jgi:hypothetical protein